MTVRSTTGLTRQRDASRRSSKVHYQVNICGGDFEHVKACFRQWKEEPLVYWSSHRMFEGKEEVRPATDRVVGDGEVAQAMLRELCDPHAPFALAAEVRAEGRDMWLVMAAYEE